jgi:hypothetical protein
MTLTTCTLRNHRLDWSHAMFISNHVLAGAVIGTRLPPGKALVAGFASHLAMDNLPHWGVPGPFPITAAKRDGVLGLGLLAACAGLASKERRVNVLAGMFGACLPDTDKLGEYFAGRSPWPAAFDDFHKWLQRESPHRIPHEVLAGVALAAVAVALLRRS